MSKNNAINSTIPIAVSQGGTGAASFLAESVMCGGITSSSALQAVSQGTTYQALTSNGAGALPSFQNYSVPGQDSASRYINSQTASGALFQMYQELVGYDTFLILFENVTFTGSSNTLSMLLGYGAGPTFPASNYNGVLTSFSSSGDVESANSTTQYNIVSPTSSSSMAGYIYVSGVSGSGNKTILSSASYNSGAAFANGSGQWQNSNPVTSLSFQMATGNIGGIFWLLSFHD